MFGVVAADDHKLPFAIEIENIDDVQPARAFFRACRANSSPEQKAENVNDEERGDEERHDCSQNREQL